MSDRTAGQRLPDLLAKAIAKHQSGQLGEAEAAYQQIISIDPRHSLALHNLGVIAHHQRRHQKAIELISSAIKIDASNPGYYYNLANAYHALQRYEEAILQYKKALALKGDYVAAHFNHANALAALKRFDEAEFAYRSAIRFAPNIAEVHHNLADALNHQGKTREAEESYRRALAINSQFVPSLHDLSRLLFEKGQAAEALALSVRLLAVDKNTQELFVDYARHCSRMSILPHPINGLQEALTKAIEQNWVRANEVMGLAVRALEFDPQIAQALESADRILKNREVALDRLQDSEPFAFPANRLLRIIMKTAPISNMRFENFLTLARRVLLARTKAKREITANDATHLQFFCDLATQCFVTEYVFSTLPQETTLAEEIRDALVRELSTAATITPLQIACTAAYFPLDRIAGIERLLQQNWPKPLADLLNQQAREPLEENRLRASIPKLTPVRDSISLKVESQYEENPYPRWVEAARTANQPSRIDDYLRLYFPSAPIASIEQRQLNILIAGCGTGRQSVEIALQFPEAHILAIDLSLAALAFAKRKTDHYHIKNIEYGQADIVEIGSIGRNFDVIFASGVLHHLANPLDGWRKLVALLPANGFMNVALYSERAREDIVAAQRFVAEHGYKPTQEGIRACREEFRQLPDDLPLKKVTYLADFYSISELRDLLFHVQEHRISLPQIANFLADNHLRFIGFDVAPYTLRQYLQKYPDDPAGTNLAHWNSFEQEHPRAFIGMYQFWLQKNPAL